MTLAWRPGTACRCCSHALARRRRSRSRAARAASRGGSFASLNLGFATPDDPADVAENRRRALAAAGADPLRAVSLRQRHGSGRRRGGRGRAGSYLDAATTWPEGDALVTSRARACRSSRTARTASPRRSSRAGGDAPGGRPRRLARARRRRARGGRRARRARVLGGRSGRGPAPAATPSARTSPAQLRARFGDDVVADGRADLAACARRALERARRRRGRGRRALHDLRRASASTRTAATARAAAGRASSPILETRVSVELEVVRENLAGRARGDRRGRAPLGPRGGRGRAAGGGQVRGARGHGRRSPPPASSSSARTASSSCWPSRRSRGDRFAWDFIGHLQSRKARDLVGRVRLVHSLSTLSAAERLDRSSETPVACLVEVNVAGEDSKEGLAPDDLDEFLEAVARCANIRVEGLMTMPPLAEAAGGVAALLRGAARARASGSASAGRRSTLRPPVDGDEPGLRRGRGGGGDDRAPRIDPLPPVERIVSPLMGLGDVWYKTKVYFGLAEDDDLYEDDEDGAIAEEDLEQRYRRRPNVRPLDARRGRGEVRVDDIFSEDAPPAGRRSPPARRGRRRRRCCARPSRVGAEDVPEGLPERAAHVQRRAADRRPLQARHPGHHQPADRRARAREAPDRLRLRPHVRPRGPHAAHRRQGLPAHARERRAVRRGPGALPRRAASSTRPEPAARWRTSAHADAGGAERRGRERPRRHRHHRDVRHAGPPAGQAAARAARSSTASPSTAPRAATTCSPSTST